MALEPWRTGKVIRVEEPTPGLRRFFIEATEVENFDFKPGQFVTLDLPIHEKPNKRWRSYSIASWPDGTNGFELCIVLMEGGAGTEYLFNEVKEGSILTYRGPVGVFTLPEKVENDLYLICTGTGIAPFRSMLHHISLHNIPHQDVYLIFGSRKRHNLLYYDEMRELTQNIPGLHYIPTLSREEWEGKTGYVHDVYEELVKHKSYKTTVQCDALFYLCGWKNMIDEAKKRIIDLGFDKKCIRQELYG